MEFELTSPAGQSELKKITRCLEKLNRGICEYMTTRGGYTRIWSRAVAGQRGLRVRKSSLKRGIYLSLLFLSLINQIVFVC